jgi:DNA-binding CsgD family transcriptional regulator
MMTVNYLYHQVGVPSPTRRLATMDTNESVSSKTDKTQTTLEDATVYDPKSITIELPLIFGGAALALYVYWFFSLLFSPLFEVFLGGVILTVHPEQMYRATYFIGSALFFLLAIIGTHFLLHLNVQALTIAGSILLPLPLMALLIALQLGSTASSGFWMVAWALVGVANGIFFYRSGLFLSMTKSATRGIAVVAVAFGCAALLHLMLSTISSKQVTLYIFVIIPLLITVLFQLAKYFSPPEDNFDSLESIRAWRTNPIHSMTVLFSLGLLFGFPASRFDVFAGDWIDRWLLSGVLLSVMLLCVLAGWLLIKRRVFLTETQSYCLPLLTVALLPHLLPFEKLHLACCVFSIICFIFFKFIQVLITADYMRELRLQAVFLFSTDALMLSFGTALGWLVGYLTSTELGTRLLWSPVATVVLIILAIVLIDWRGRNESNGQEVLMMRPPHTNQNKGKWKQRCQYICEKAELSPRQTEVFKLLVRGRNARFISEELFIAPHTAKAHIYRIYQKLGIHTQQELIDLIEKYDC